MSSRMSPRHYLSRSSSQQSQSQSDEDPSRSSSQQSQSQSDEDPSRQVGQETYQGDFATMDPAMQRQNVSSMTTDGREMSEGMQGMQQGMQQGLTRMPQGMQQGKEAGKGMIGRSSRMMDMSNIPEEVNELG